MRAGLRANRYEEIPDRTEAIRKAVRLAVPGDIILIAGKGHENYQEFADRKIPFDDCAVALRAIEDRRVDNEKDYPKDEDVSVDRSASHHPASKSRRES